MKINYYSSIIVGIFLVLIGIVGIYTGNLGQEYALGNSDPFDVYFHSWLSHISWSSVFFFFGFLLITKSNRKEKSITFSKNLKKIMIFVGILSFAPYIVDLTSLVNFGYVEPKSDANFLEIIFSVINLNFFLVIIGIVILLAVFKLRKNI